MLRLKIDKYIVAVAVVFVSMTVYFLLSQPQMMDDGFHYEGFAESLAHGRPDFKSFYGFQGLSILSVPVFWLTGSHISIIITSAVLFLLSIPLAYFIGKEFYQDKISGLTFTALILLMPYAYTTMMRGFQEAALLFFVLLIVYAAIKKKFWTPLVWAFGGIVKPFALTLFPLWLGKNIFSRRRIAWLLAALTIGVIYLGASYYQTGYLVNNAAINSYQGDFDTGNPPPLIESFEPSVKGLGRVAANLLVHSRKILISPLVVLLGFWVLLKDRAFRLRKPIIISIALNILLVGSLSFSFPKYLLPMIALLALTAVPAIIKGGWPIQALVLADSFFVFKPIYDYFGNNFWQGLGLYLLPFYLTLGIFMIIRLKKDESNA